MTPGFSDGSFGYCRVSLPLLRASVSGTGPSEGETPERRHGTTDSEFNPELCFTSVVPTPRGMTGRNRCRIRHSKIPGK